MKPNQQKFGSALRSKGTSTLIVKQMLCKWIYTLINTDIYWFVELQWDRSQLRVQFPVELATLEDRVPINNQVDFLKMGMSDATLWGVRNPNLAKRYR